MLSSVAPRPINMTVKTTEMEVQASASGVSNPGRSGNVNQDAFFLLKDEPNQTMVFGVFDGHGRETGKDAAWTAKAFFEAQFRAFTAEEYAQLEVNPEQMMTQMFSLCHLMIKSTFRSTYEHRGYIVEEDDETGALIRREHDDPYGGVCIRGGTTATIVVTLHGGAKIITANVGDSIALLGCDEPILSEQDMTTLDHDGTAKMLGHQKHRFRDEIKRNYLVLTGTHSADSDHEYRRIRSSSSSDETNNGSQLQFLYDSSNLDHHQFSIFETTPGGVLQRNPRGAYFKNVRDEWATIVTTPADAPFPDSLAFTRSLGDFHMHAYGVCDKPTVRVVSLEDAIKRSTTNQSDAGLDICPPVEFFLTVASDGIWDNWKYDGLLKFVFQHEKPDGPSRPDLWALMTMPAREEDLSHHHAIHELTESLLSNTLTRAEHFFGDQADNMTVILSHLAFKLT
ncbi:hypothetical protein Poli38472_003703 [Pythium oligandrum]|uniref:PPM-type phosphatase domain-containing protein n=1 Tax=Pythium oligandrum TaxID=41045 RepID=A0A8K1FPT4_PYTOL|nr:hypothetical protein Poli38472_003703 [Pythium oligandrum]|eukprot:TMW65938.1 hypothetical protein Poli38472_003703 [Pythium oligandrum]